MGAGDDVSIVDVYSNDVIGGGAFSEVIGVSNIMYRKSSQNLIFSNDDACIILEASDCVL